MNTQDLESVLSDFNTQKTIVEHNETAFDEAESTLKESRHVLYALQSTYREERRAYISKIMQEYSRSLCAYCGLIRPTEQMRTCRESGSYMETDCRYNRWEQKYENFFPICQSCVTTMTFSTDTANGSHSAKELIQFDLRRYESWFTWGSERIEAAAKALKLSLPDI